MPAHPYRPSGLSEPGALPILAGGCLAVAVLVGIAEGWVSQWVDLLILFPAVIGLASGGFASRLIASRKVRSPVAAASLALLGAWAGQATVHIVEYSRFRRAFVEKLDELQQKAIAKNRADPDAIKRAGQMDLSQEVDRVLERETGKRGFLGYLKMTADSGIELKRTARDSGVSVSGVGAYVLWLLNFLIAGAVAFFIARERATKPFCELCKSWYLPEQTLAAGSPDAKDWRSVVDSLDNRNWPEAVERLGTPTTKSASVIALERCGQCQEHEPLLTFKVVTGRKTNRPQRSIKYRTLIRPDEAKSLVEALSPQRPP